MDYAVSSKRTQQKRRKTLRETTVLMAANPQSEVQLLKDTFEVISDKLADNFYSTLNIMKNNENMCPVLYKSVATCLTANLSLNDAFKISGINYSTISKYRKKLNVSKLFVQKKHSNINESYMQKLDEWGEVNVFTTSGKSQKRMPHKSFEDNYQTFSKYYNDKVGYENSTSLQWFTENVKKRKWLNAKFDRYRCSICFLGNKARKLINDGSDINETNGSD